MLQRRVSGVGTLIVEGFGDTALPSFTATGSVRTTEEEREKMLVETLVRLTDNQKRLMVLSLLSFLALC